MNRLRSLLPGLLMLTLALTLAGCVAVPPSPDRPQRIEFEPADAAKHARLRLELAGMYMSRGQTSTALDEVKRAIAAKPEMAEAHSLLGLIHGAMGEQALADESFQRALQLGPGDGDILHNYGWFLCQQRRWPESDVQFNAARALPQYRDGVRTLLAQGVCQARAGRWPQAERTLSRSYELDPANPITAYNLSEVLMRLGELERARFYIGRVNARPELTSAQTLWMAARIEQRLGNAQGVQDFGRKLQERYPESNEVLLYERGRFDD